MLTKILRTFWPNPQKKRAASLYIALVAQARNPFFYRELGVADSVDGRFDMIVLHVALAVGALEHFTQSEVIQLRNALMEYLIEDMDRNLREMGISDTSVSKKMKKLASQLNGRFAKYHAATSDADWHEALMRNVYRTESAEGVNGLADLAAYAHATQASFSGMSADAWLAATPSFGTLAEAAQAA